MTAPSDHDRNAALVERGRYLVRKHRGLPFGPQEGYAGMTDEDALDIAQYLAALPPVVHAADDQCTFPPPPTGETALGTQ
jgi:cytochrome c